MESEHTNEFQLHLPEMIGFHEADELFAYVDKHPEVAENSFLLNGLDVALQYARQGEVNGAIVISGKMLLVCRHVSSSLENLAALVVGHCYSLEPEWHASSVELLIELVTSAEAQKEIEIGRMTYLLLAKLQHQKSNFEQTEIALINSLAFMADDEEKEDVFSPEGLQRKIVLLSMIEQGELYLRRATEMQQSNAPKLPKEKDSDNLQVTDVLQQGYAVSMMEASYAYYTESIKTLAKAQALTQLGNLYLELTRHQEAEELFFASLSFCEAKGHIEGAAEVYFGIAKLLIARERPGDAKIMLGKSYELFENIENQKGKEKVLQSLKAL